MNATRKRGIANLNASAANISDVYSLAVAARKARDRQQRRSVDQGVLGANRFASYRNEDRAGMLRAAYAAQRVEHGLGYGYPSLQSETSTFSHDSGLDFLLGASNQHEPGPEEFLLDLGFGGPAQGVERVPKRFLKPSQLNGVDITKYIMMEQEIEEIVETASLGYRGLSGRGGLDFHQPLPD